MERLPELSMNVTVNGSVGEASLSTVVPAEMKSEETARITRVTLENVPLYYSNGMLILENGKAYSVSGMFPDYPSLLGDIAALYKDAEYTGDGSVYNVGIDGPRAAELMRTLCPALSENTERIKDACVELTVENGSVRRINIRVSGVSTGGEFDVSAWIDGFERSAAFNVPEAVLTAAQNNAEGLPEISGDIFRLLSAWVELDGRTSAASTLRLSADCGPVILDTALDVSTRVIDGRRIYCVGKNELRLYTDGVSVVNRNGDGVTNEEAQLAGSASLPEAVYLACLNGDISAARDGEKYTYTVALGGDDIRQLVGMISPAASKLDADFAYGSVSLTVAEGKISEITVKCTGTMKVVLVETPVSVSASFIALDGKAPQFPEKAVSALTQTNG